MLSALFEILVSFFVATRQFCNLVSVAILNSVSVRISMMVQTWMTLAKIGAIFVIVIGGWVMLAEGKVQYLASGFHGNTESVGAVAIAFYNGLWAYDGWNNLNYCTEELINPNK